MKAVVQRVLNASVTAGDYYQSIEQGYLVLLGVHTDDNEDDYQYILKKILSLRVFEDEQGKMNLSIHQVNGAILLVSQFTLLGSVKGNNRPSFTKSAAPDMANTFYERLYTDLNQSIQTKKGVFGAHMAISLVNDGPVTIIIDSKE
ncbi:MAG: D-tyrosyl-tRNA(Tyr) deacylase [Tenericutes bacterium HGW-Tenericutes-8]|nr:MAG: D-tyrosyl-tRNA(Tyr) deacylase [Tenericutes bacterium HGW-Tenericutes-8]